MMDWSSFSTLFLYLPWPLLILPSVSAAEHEVKANWKDFYEIAPRDEDAETRFQVCVHFLTILRLAM